MNDAFRVDVINTSQQLLKNASSLYFCEPFLLSNALEKLASLQQFHDDICMCLIREKGYFNTYFNVLTRQHEYISIAK